jgi:hypothetical protein
VVEMLESYYDIGGISPDITGASPLKSTELFSEEGEDARLSGLNKKPAWLSSMGLMSEGEFRERRKSLDCTSLRVSINGAVTTTRRSGDTPFTVYVIDVLVGVQQWSVRRRYSDFYYVHNLIKEYVEDIPALPPKRYFGSSSSSKFVEERRIQLETYLREVVRKPQVWDRSDVVQFLDSDNNTLMFVWNFERMRRMQEVRSYAHVGNVVLTYLSNVVSYWDR